MATPTCPIAKGSSNPGVTDVRARPPARRPMRRGRWPAASSCGPALLSREAHVSPTAVPQRSEPGAWLARYGELQNSLFVTLARPLGMARAGGRDAFDDLFQIAATAAWIRERDGEPIRNPRAFLRQVIINQRKMQLRSERRHPATSYDEIMVTAEGDGGSGIDAIADRRPSVAEQVERREVAEIVTHILLTVERRARTVWAMRWLEHRTPDGGRRRPRNHPSPICAAARAREHRNQPKAGGLPRA